MISLVLAAALALQAAPAAQFDLICEGQKTLTFTDDNTEEKSDFTARYRIDLDRSLWCGMSCSSLRPMGVYPTRLVLSDTDQHRMWVDRSTGYMENHTRLPGTLGTTTARCRVAPFSGMAAQQF